MDIKGKKFTVVGGAGLIGSHTVDELLKEDVAEVTVFDNLSRGCEENLADVINDPRLKLYSLGANIMHTDHLETAFKGVDGVFHFAALWLLQCYDYPRSAFDVNMGGTFNILEAIVNNGVKKLVFSSSASVYGDAVHEPMDEDHPYNNQNFYGATKIAGEHMCRSFFKRHQGTEKHFDYAGLRYFNVYGPRQDYHGAYIAVIMKILDQLEKGISPTVYGDGSQAYDFIYVGDCAKANVAAMKSDTTDNFFNVCTGNRTSIKDLANMLINMTSSKLDLSFQEADQMFVKNRIGCPKKAKKIINFEAKMKLEEGLKHLIKWRDTHKSEVDQRRKAVER
jgi:UDP-glucose 4-epimerase